MCGRRVADARRVHTRNSFWHNGVPRSIWKATQCLKSVCSS